MLGNQIKDLQGNIFSVGDWAFATQIPTGIYIEFVFTRDYLTGKRFNLVSKDNKYFGYFYLSFYNLYIKYNLDKIGYEESLDIRKAYLYANKRKHT